MIRRVIPQPTERQLIGNQINAAMIFAWTDLINVHWRFLLSLSRCRVKSKRGRIRRVKHWIATLAILVTLFASLVVSAPIIYATDLRGGVVGHAGSLVGVGVALFEVKPNKTLHLVRQTVTAPGGNYYFNKVRPGQYVVRIRKIDYPLEVRETEMQDIPIITAPRH